MNNEPKVLVSTEKRASAARSQFYKILSCAFTYPGGEEMQSFVREYAMLALRETVGDLPFDLPIAASSLAKEYAMTEDLALTYSRLFDNCTGTSLVSLHEKDYSARDMQLIWEDLIRFYEHFGLQYDLKVSGLYPDHLGVQLEFLHYVTFLESVSKAETENIYIAAEFDFLERHLACWATRFADKLASAAASSPYSALAKVLDEFVREELEFNRNRRLVQ